jgi:hypothetical protein
MLETYAKDEETNRQLPFVRREMRCSVVRKFDSLINEKCSGVLLCSSTRLRVRV